MSEIQIQGTAPNQTFYIVDGDFPTQPESILGYNFGSSANLPWETAPNLIGYQITPVGPEGGLGNVYAQLTQSTVSNLLYVSNQRNNLACPDMAIYDPVANAVAWNSFIPTGSGVGTATGDYFVQAGNGGTGSANGGLVASAVSPDGLFLVGLHIDNHLTVVGLTNGIPDVNTLFYVTPPSFGQNGRGIAIDAGDNVIVSSSGAGAGSGIRRSAAPVSPPLPAIRAAPPITRFSFRAPKSLLSRPRPRLPKVVSMGRLAPRFQACSRSPARARMGTLLL